MLPQKGGAIVDASSTTARRVRVNIAQLPELPTRDDQPRCGNLHR
jgi:hypothetical protein